MGLALSGKTTLGKELARRTGTHHVDVDDDCARCAPPQQKDPHLSKEGQDRERKRMRVAYTLLHEAVKANLQAGWPVIVSAMYSTKASQEFLRRAIEENGGKLKLIWCVFDDTEEEITRRIEKRISQNEAGGVHSVSHYLEGKARHEGTDLPHLKVNTSQDLGVVVETALAYIAKSEEG